MSADGNAFWSNQIREWETRQKKCAKCDAYFRELDNLGRWLCTQHASFEKPPIGERWKCCGAKRIGGSGVANRGCVKADHTVLSVPLTAEHDVPVPSVIFGRLGLSANSPSIIKPDDPTNVEINTKQTGSREANNFVMIRRFDYKRSTVVNDYYDESKRSYNLL